MSTATATQTAEAIDRGRVGARELIAVQTSDVARLTTHVTPVLPGTFIAVSGIGPKGDSNGSGKTSFLGAVTVLLADPQWRLDIDGGQMASGLLFKPEAAGVDAVRYAAATHGYIVGVFADTDTPSPATALTVWVRLSRTAPYLQVRTKDGIVLADADTEEGRDGQVDVLWDALGKDGQCSARAMSQTLYGDAPRCMAYLDTPLRHAAPSLLSQQMTEMSPAAIGQSLIDLAGLRHHFEAEQEQRNKLAGQQRRLVDTTREHEERLREEVAELTAIDQRSKARDLLARGALMWRLHFAKRYITIVPEHDAATQELADAQETVALAKAAVTKAQTAYDRIRTSSNLSKAAEDAANEHTEASQAREALDVQVAGLKGQLAPHTGARPALAHRAAGSGAVTVAAAETTIDRTQAGLASAGVALRHAATAETDAQHDLEAARSGRTPQTAAALAALDVAGIDAVALSDTISLDEAPRPFWEPVLRLWLDAVIVAPDDLHTAAQAVEPGTILVRADGPLTASGPTPHGVHTGVPLSHFLTVAADRHERRTDPDRVVDTAAGVVVVGGFGSPLTGRDARVAAAGAALAAAEAAHGEAGKVVARWQRDVQAAKENLDAATAVRDLAVSDAEVARLSDKIEQVQRALPAAMAAEAAAKQRWLDARSLAEGHESAIWRAHSALTTQQAELTTAERDRNDAQAALDKIALAYWATGWGGTVEQARALLDDQDDETRSLKFNTLRKRASDALRDGLNAYGAAVTDLPTDLEAVKERGEGLDDSDEETRGVVSFADVAHPLQVRLDGAKERDAITRSAIGKDRHTRQDALADLQVEFASITSSLNTLQEIIERIVDDHFKRISEALNRLDLARGGNGAEVRFSSRRPESPTGTWHYEAAPRWRRAPGGAMVNYREVANGAQVKVFAVQVTLAALLAADVSTRAGQVLVIDELGNSLGDVNRKDVLNALQRVAEDQRVTIFGTCQDSVLFDAAEASKSLLWFTHASEYDAYNQPVAVWAYDDNTRRVKMTADWVCYGRPWL